jgi:hypothetical protein
MTVYTRIKLTQYHVPEATAFRLLQGGGNTKVKQVCDIPTHMCKTAWQTVLLFYCLMVIGSLKQHQYQYTKIRLQVWIFGHFKELLN